MSYKEEKTLIDIDSLSWYLPIEEQRINMAKLRITSTDVAKLILPFQKQECWENCAILLASLNDDKLIPFLPQILEWYKDLNWPGIEVISNRMTKFPVHLLKKYLIAALDNAKKQNDDEWYENLSHSFQDLL